MIAEIVISDEELMKWGKDTLIGDRPFRDVVVEQRGIPKRYRFEMSYRDEKNRCTVYRYEV